MYCVLIITLLTVMFFLLFFFTWVDVFEPKIFWKQHLYILEVHSSIPRREIYIIVVLIWRFELSLTKVRELKCPIYLTFSSYIKLPIINKSVPKTSPPSSAPHLTSDGRREFTSPGEHIPISTQLHPLNLVATSFPP